jgi:hypothetical protein
MNRSALPLVQGIKGLCKVACNVGGSVIRHHLPELNAIAVEPGHSTAHKANGRGLLFVCEHFDVGETRCVVNRDVKPVVANTRRAALLAVAGEAMPDLTGAGQLLDVDVDQVGRCLALVEVERRFRFHLSQHSQPQAIQSPRHGGEGGDQQPGDVA